MKIYVNINGCKNFRYNVPLPSTTNCRPKKLTVFMVLDLMFFDITSIRQFINKELLNNVNYHVYTNNSHLILE